MSNPFNPSGMGGMLGGMQQMVQNLKSQAAQATAEGTAGGGLVKVVASGDQQIVSISIADEALEDRELLEDLLRAATNEAMRAVQEKVAEKMASLAGGMGLPPGLFNGF